MFRSYFLLLLCLKYVYGLKKEMCAYRDEICLTEGVRQHVYSMFVAGVPGVETSDPMKFDEIVVDLPDSVYKLHQANVTGFRTCHFQKLKLTQDEQNHTVFDYEVLCPTLTLHSNYELNNAVGLLPNKDRGNCEIVYKNYFITLKGTYKIVTDEYGKPHISIVDCNPILDLQEGTTCKFNSEIIESGKFDKYYSEVEELSRQTVMGTVMGKYMENLRNFLDAIPIEDMHFRYV